MKKYIIAGVLVLAFVAYVIFANKNQPSVAVAPSGTTSGTPATTEPTSTPTATSTGTTIGSTGQYKNGTYTGSVADAFYGNLQVRAVIQGGVLVDVQFPQAPSGGHSSDVSAIALPQLRQEAIAAQSANVNIVSGATQDS